MATASSSSSIVQASKKRRQRNTKLSLLQDTKTRNLVFQKRNRTVLKKARELSEICGVQTCTIVFNEDGSKSSWPENPAEVEDIINLYKEQQAKCKKAEKLDISGLIDRQKTKYEKNNRQIEKKEQENLSSNFDKILDQVPDESIMEIYNFVESKLQRAKERKVIMNLEAELFKDLDEILFEEEEASTTTTDDTDLQEIINLLAPNS